MDSRVLKIQWFPDNGVPCETGCIHAIGQTSLGWFYVMSDIMLVDGPVKYRAEVPLKHGFAKYATWDSVDDAKASCETLFNHEVSRCLVDGLDS